MANWTVSLRSFLYHHLKRYTIRQIFDKNKIFFFQIPHMIFLLALYPSRLLSDKRSKFWMILNYIYIEWSSPLRPIFAHSKVSIFRSHPMLRLHILRITKWHTQAWPWKSLTFLKFLLLFTFLLVDSSRNGFKMHFW